MRRVWAQTWEGARSGGHIRGCGCRPTSAMALKPGRVHAGGGYMRRMLAQAWEGGAREWAYEGVAADPRVKG